MSLVSFPPAQHPRGEQEPGRGFTPSNASILLHASPWVCVYIIVPIITDTSTSPLLLYLQHSVYVWGVINTAGETKSSSLLLVVSEEIYVKQFV